MKILLYILVFIQFILSNEIINGAFSITRIHYDGGGDWYSDPSSLQNLLKFVDDNTNIVVNLNEKKARIGDEVFSKSLYLYMTGHGNISFSDDEAFELRKHLKSGAFLHADDNYGMDESFRNQIKKVFPDKQWVELPPNHEVFHIYYNFNDGLPKIHEHDNKRPQALALFENEKMVVLYTYESDLGDGWEDKEVHKDSEEVRENALKMGTNIIIYALTR
tara:strand:- start:3623 stop:4279 length:657 start_codon:yes stop_codon:yes gene_type:complete